MTEYAPAPWVWVTGYNEHGMLHEALYAADGTKVAGEYGPCDPEHARLIEAVPEMKDEMIGAFEDLGNLLALAAAHGLGDRPAAVAARERLPRMADVLAQALSREVPRKAASPASAAAGGAESLLEAAQ